MDNNENQHIKDVIDAIAGGNASAATDSFNQIMQNKKDAELEGLKLKSAANFFSDSEQETNSPTEEE